MPGIVIIYALPISFYFILMINSWGITTSVTHMMKVMFGEFKVLAHVLIHI